MSLSRDSVKNCQNTSSPPLKAARSVTRFTVGHRESSFPRVIFLPESDAKCDSKWLCSVLCAKSEKAEKVVILVVILFARARTRRKSRIRAFSDQIED